MTVTATVEPEAIHDADGNPDSQLESPGRMHLALAEATLWMVHLAAALQFRRVFETDDFLLRVVALLTVTSASSVLARLRRLPTAASTAASVAVTLVVAAWLWFPSTTAWGVPTAETLRVALDSLGESAEQFRTVIAPTEALVGFQLLVGLALSASVLFADWAAFRLRATLEALTPATVIYLFTAVLAPRYGNTSSALWFAPAALVHIVCHRAWLASRTIAWLGSSPDEGASGLRLRGLFTAMAAILVAFALVPQVPGLHDEPIVRWREQDGGSTQRDTVSPIVDVRGRLLRQTNRVMFTVRSTSPAYWRLTSLNNFDGRIWSSSAEFQEADGRLPTVARDAVRSRRVIQDFQVESLGALWAPAAFEARELPSASGPMLWDSESSTLIVDDSLPSSDGLRYSVASEVPVLDPELLRFAGGPEDRALLDTYLALPADLPPVVREEADRVVAGLDNRYDRARALQDFFHSSRFRYSTEVPSGHGNDALVAFLESGAGYCEQFAGTYAAMARAVGLPSRVAVGFTSGDADPEDPTFYRVRGVHAHAWPEVHFPGIGWVPFEPTKGRGIPGAESYTGLAEAQEHGPDDAATTTTASTTTTSPLRSGTSAPSPPATTAPPPARGTSVGASEVTETTGRQWAALVMTAVLVVMVGTILAAPWLRRRLRRRHDDRRSQVLGAWADVMDPLRWRTGVIATASETHQELAVRAAPHLGELSPTLSELADLATSAAWSPESPSPAQTERATILAQEFRQKVLTAQPPSQRLRRRLSWREAFGRVRPSY